MQGLLYKEKRLLIRANKFLHVFQKLDGQDLVFMVAQS